MAKCIELTDGTDVLFPMKVKEVTATLTANQWVPPFTHYTQVDFGLSANNKIVSTLVFSPETGSSTNPIACKCLSDNTVYCYGMRAADITVRCIYI